MYLLSRANGKKTGQKFSAAFHHALGVVGELRNEGMTIVPTQPTPDMVAAGCQISELSADAVESIYLAMLRAVK